MGKLDGLRRTNVRKTNINDLVCRLDRLNNHRIDLENKTRWEGTNCSQLVFLAILQNTCTAVQVIAADHVAFSVQ